MALSSSFRSNPVNSTILSVFNGSSVFTFASSNLLLEAMISGLTPWEFILIFGTRKGCSQIVTQLIYLEFRVKLDVNSLEYKYL